LSTSANPKRRAGDEFERSSIEARAFAQIVTFGAEKK
jgi:hypothetical protein